MSRMDTKIEGILRELKWGLKAHHLQKGEKVYVTGAHQIEGVPHIEISWHSTDFKFDGSWKVLVNVYYIDAEQIFSSQDSEKIRLKTISKEKITYQELEETLKLSIDELKYVLRGSLKSKKFGL